MPQYEDFHQLLNSICKSAAELLHASASSIYLKEGDEVVMHGAYGYSSILLHRARYRLGEGITGWVAEGKGHEYKGDSQAEICKHPCHAGKYNDEIWKSEKRTCHSLVAIPLLIGDDVYGLIKVENKRSNRTRCAFEREDLNRLRLFLGALSDAIQRDREIMAALGRYFVFVLMPFSTEYLNVYDCIKQAAKEVDMLCTRSDEDPIIGKISDRIHESIKKADVVVSVMTERNPNVFYETGYAHAIYKPTIHIAKKSEEIPFDLKDYNHLFYKEKNLPLLRDDLVRYFAHVKSNILTRGAKRGIGGAGSPLPI